MLSAAAIVPLAVMAGLGLRALESAQAEQAERVGRELARSVANAVDAELRSAIVVLETLATAPTLDRNDFEGFRELAERARRLRPHWAAIVLLAPDGTPLVDTRHSRAGDLALDLDAPSFSQVVRTGTAASGNLMRGPDAGWFVPVHVPVLDSGTVRLVVTGIITPDAIRSVLIRQQLPSDWVISIVDDNGLRVARSRAHEANLGGRLSETVQQVVAGGQPEGFGIAYTLEGERIYSPYSRLSNGWMAVLGFPTALADAAATGALFRYGGGMLLSLALGVLGALWVARTITLPIARLRNAAEAVGRRQRPTMPKTTILEIREVAAALASAADDLTRGEAEREELLRKERVARETAEAADRAKDEFMAVLSHELRTPLNAVFGWARMLQAGELGNEATAARATDAIVRNAGVQMRLIDDLLDLSRIASGKLHLDLAPVDLPQVLRNATDAVRPAAEAKAIRLHTALDPEAGCITGDASRLQQIASNLLMNAVKFTPNGGDVRLQLVRDTAHVRIVVSDTGQGIEPAMLPHVFERFRQSDSSSTRSHGGLGLGLALVKHLVELHDGAVRADSRGPNQGATFTVTLPAAATEALQRPDAAVAGDADGTPAPLTRLDGLRVLVVDDDVESLRLADTILTRAGATVRACRTAAEGLAELRAWRPDVAVSDIEMPSEDGYSLIRTVRALPSDEGGATPAIALTAYGRSEDRTRALAAGFDRHLPKPVEPGELTRIIGVLAAETAN